LKTKKEREEVKDFRYKEMIFREAIPALPLKPWSGTNWLESFETLKKSSKIMEGGRYHVGKFLILRPT